MNEQYELALDFGNPVESRVPFVNTCPTPQEMVLEFHEATRAIVNNRKSEHLPLRMRLLDEEEGELYDELYKLRHGSMDEQTLLAAAKEMADLVYVIYGTAVTLGIDLDEAVRRVHASNMSKLGVDGKPILREDGKVLKGPNYFEPDLKGVILDV